MGRSAHSYREPPSSSDSVRQSHTVRLLRWDDTRVLLYWTAKQPDLQKRKLSENSGWVIHLSLISLADGKSEKNYTLPARTRFVELAVHPDAVILSDGGRLRFFTREFTEAKESFFYKPLHTPVEMGRAGPVGDVEHLHIAPDANHFVLVDSYGETSQFFVFGVLGYTLNSHWIVSGVDSSSVSIGSTKYPRQIVRQDRLCFSTKSWRR